MMVARRALVALLPLCLATGCHRMLPFGPAGEGGLDDFSHADSLPGDGPGDRGLERGARDASRDASRDLPPDARRDAPPKSDSVPGAVPQVGAAWCEKFATGGPSLSMMHWLQPGHGVLALVAIRHLAGGDATSLSASYDKTVALSKVTAFMVGTDASLSAWYLPPLSAPEVSPKSVVVDFNNGKVAGMVMCLVNLAGLPSFATPAFGTATDPVAGLGPCPLVLDMVMVLGPAPSLAKDSAQTLNGSVLQTTDTPVITVGSSRRAKLPAGATMKWTLNQTLSWGTVGVCARAF